MKFFISVVLCCLTVGALANVLPLTLNSKIVYSTAYGPGITVDNHQPIVLKAGALPSVSHLYQAPLIVPVGLKPAEGTYIAKTLGSEHIASLPGHLNSASSINLELAPGTNKDGILKDSSSLVPSVAIHGSTIPTAAIPLSVSPFIVPVPHVVPVTAEATYVAKNLGIEHIAPLPGHSVSAISLNLQPAPGSN